MDTTARARTPEHRRQPAGTDEPAPPAREPPPAGAAGRMRELQRVAGNRAATQMLARQPSASDVAEAVDDYQDLDEHGSVASWKIGTEWKGVQLNGKVRLSTVQTENLKATELGFDVKGPSAKKPKTELEAGPSKKKDKGEWQPHTLEYKAKIKSGLSALAINGYYNVGGLILGGQFTIDGPQYEAGRKLADKDIKGALVLVTVRLRFVGRLEDVEHGTRLDVQGDLEGKVTWEAAAALVKAGAVRVAERSAARLAQAATKAAQQGQKVLVDTAEREVARRKSLLEFDEYLKGKRTPGTEAYARAEERVVRRRLQLREAEAALQRAGSKELAHELEREALQNLRRPSRLMSIGRFVAAPLRRVLGTRLAKTIGRVLLRAIPILNIAMTIWDIAEIGFNIYKLIRYGPGSGGGGGEGGKDDGEGGKGGSSPTKTGSTGEHGDGQGKDAGAADGTAKSGPGTGDGRAEQGAPGGTPTGTSPVPAPRQPPAGAPEGVEGGDRIAGLAARLNRQAGLVAAALEWRADDADGPGVTFTAAELERLNAIVPETTPDQAVEALIDLLGASTPTAPGSPRTAAELLRLVELWLQHLDLRPAAAGTPSRPLDLARARRLNPIEQRSLGFTPAEFTGEPGTGAGSDAFALAVAEYQRLNGLEVDGIAGPQTIAAWREDEGGPGSRGAARARAEGARRWRARHERRTPAAGSGSSIDEKVVEGADLLRGFGYLRLDPGTNRLVADPEAIRRAVGRKLVNSGGFSATVTGVDVEPAADSDGSQNVWVLIRFHVDAKGRAGPDVAAGEAAVLRMSLSYDPVTRRRSTIVLGEVQVVPPGKARAAP